MRTKHLFFPILALLLAVIACNITPTITTVTPDGGGGGSGGVGVTPDDGGGGIIPTVTETSLPPLPPPAMAVLRVVYIKGGDVWAWTEGSGSMQLTISGDAYGPLLSGDGQVVAFMRNGKLWAVNADGTNERQLVSAAYLAGLVAIPGDEVIVDKVVWQPGSHQVFFNTLIVTRDSGFQVPQFDLHWVDADAPVATVVNYETPGSGGVPYPSPDGSVVALAQPDKVIFMAVNGDFWNVAFTFPSVYTYSEWMFVPELFWLPAGDAVRLVVPVQDPLSDPTAPSEFWNVPVSGSPTLAASFVTIPAFGSTTYISPDRDQVLYLVENAGHTEIHSINGIGVDTYYFWYASGTVGLVGWSPDSIHFTFWTPSQDAPSYGSIDTNMTLGDTPSATDVQWVDVNRYMFLSGNQLRIEELSQPSTLVDTGVTEYSHGIVVY